MIELKKLFIECEECGEVHPSDEIRYKVHVGLNICVDYFDATIKLKRYTGYGKCISIPKYIKILISRDFSRDNILEFKKRWNFNLRRRDLNYNGFYSKTPATCSIVGYKVSDF